MNDSTPTTPDNDEQTRLWNGPAGRSWVESQDLLDHMYAPLADVLVDAVARSGARQVLDVGCGTGATTLAIARHLGPSGSCTGADISAPMIASARERADREGLATARFVCADAQTHPFEPASAEAIVSRFGVMFFADPVAAFANLRRAAAAGAALHCLVFRSVAENAFMTTAERAAAPLLPALPARRADGPGQFAFADRDRVASILDASGWTDIAIDPVDVTCAFPARDLGTYLTRLGPVGLALQTADEATRAQVLDAVRPAFEPFVRGADVQFTAACWKMAARA